MSKDEVNLYVNNFTEKKIKPTICLIIISSLKKKNCVSVQQIKLILAAGKVNC